MADDDDAATSFDGITLPPGLAGSVVGPHGVVLEFSVGDADIARGVAASTKMVCPWFSMSKIVIATAAMRLVDQGLLDLDAPIAPSLSDSGPRSGSDGQRHQVRRRRSGYSGNRKGCPKALQRDPAGRQMITAGGRRGRLSRRRVRRLGRGHGDGAFGGYG